MTDAADVSGFCSSGVACCVQALQKIAEDIRDKPIDVVLYVDRLDLYRVDALDKGVSVRTCA